MAFGSLSAACVDDDTGICCKPLAGRENDPTIVIPMPSTAPDGSPIDDVRIHPGFNCDDMACVIYGGAPKAYCTRTCIADSSCPEGFVCRPVLQSDPGPDSQIGPDDKFCVKDAHQCGESN